mgnify:CR=1 FL=1
MPKTSKRAIQAPPTDSLDYGRKRSQWRDVLHRLTRNKLAMLGLVIVLVLVLAAVFADFVAPYDPDVQDYTNMKAYPSFAHPLGTDDVGRDTLSRIIYGGVIMRVMDVIMAIPGFLLAVCISSALGQGIFNTALAIGIGCVPGYARLLRALVLGIRDQEYVEAARVTGASNARIMFRQIVPNILSPVIVDSTLRIGGCILMISSLSFIGLGVQPPTAEWGSMVAEGREVIRSFWPMSTFPGLAIMLTLFGFNLFGDGLRDALDPKLKN